MTIERQYGKVIFLCDQDTSPACEEFIETEEADFMEALAIAKADGWQVFPPSRPGLAFTHCCKKCLVPR